MRKAHWGLIGLVALAALLLRQFPERVSLPYPGPHGPVWPFNFAPEFAPDFANFAKVSTRTIYDESRGYGWVDLEGEIATGTFHDPSLHWESTRNLNLIQRPGPDDLASSFATGRATFEVDLEPGSYDVWFLTGDWGLLEYVPHEEYALEIEGVRVPFAGLPADEFFRRFESPGEDDTLDDAEVYERYVEPRFRWGKSTISVSDGRLSVRIDGRQRDRSLLGLLGSYAWSDARYGPKRRFAGALNAMIVTPSSPRSHLEIERIEAARRESFRTRRPREYAARPPSDLTGPELRRGYNLWFDSTIDEVTPDTMHPHEESTLELRATPGEYVPLTFAIRSHRKLGTTQIRAEAVARERGAATGFSRIDVGVVRYVASPAEDREEPRWKPAAGPIVPVESVELAAGVTKQFWLTFHVAEEADPGVYAAAIDVRPELGEPSRIRVEVEVLPFRLIRPTHLAVGVTYFVPVAHAYFGEERFWRRIRAEFEDMRRHHMTSVQLTGMGIENYDGLERLFTAYRAAGFEQPIYLLEAYGAISEVVEKYGYEERSEPFYAKYEEIFRRLMAEAERRSWPPLIVNFGDEFTNGASEDFGAELAKRLARIPGILAGADANGYREVSLLAPLVSVLAFNRGWDGPTGVNRGKRLLNRETVALVRDAGATPWLVNVGRDRLSNGLYLWKMTRLGVRGKIEWIYSDYRAFPHNPFDGLGVSGTPLVYPGPAETILPTLAWERMRQGLDDLAYLHTLEELTKAAPPGPVRQRTETLIRRIDQTIDDDFTTYEGADSERWPAERYDRLRSEVIDAIRELQRSAAGSRPQR